MKKQLPVFFTCVVIVTVYTLAFSGQPGGKKHNAQETLGRQQMAETLPEHVPYMFLFRHLGYLKEQAVRQRQQGKDGSRFQRRFKKVLELDDAQFGKLDEIAASCESDLAVLDKKADAIIKEFKKHYPDGAVPEGVIIPPPPPELLALQQERNQTILRARDRVREALGVQRFSRLDETVKTRLTPNMKRPRPAYPAP